VHLQIRCVQEKEVSAVYVMSEADCQWRFGYRSLRSRESAVEFGLGLMSACLISLEAL
jgi:hypothetical protein